jgi:hypothetical protein
MADAGADDSTAAIDTTALNSAFDGNNRLDVG